MKNSVVWIYTRTGSCYGVVAYAFKVFSFAQPLGMCLAMLLHAAPPIPYNAVHPEVDLVSRLRRPPHTVNGKSKSGDDTKTNRANDI